MSYVLTFSLSLSSPYNIIKGAFQMKTNSLYPTRRRPGRNLTALEQYDDGECVPNICSNSVRCQCLFLSLLLVAMISEFTASPTLTAAVLYFPLPVVHFACALTADGLSRLEFSERCHGFPGAESVFTFAYGRAFIK